MKTYALALDLKDDPELIKEYERHHENVWPEIVSSIKSSGIENMKIYRTGNRLFMQMTVNDSFSFEKKAKADNADPKVVEWETLMWKYQQGMPGAAPGQKWILMDEIFSLQAQGV